MLGCRYAQRRAAEHGLGSTYTARKPLASAHGFIDPDRTRRRRRRCHRSARPSPRGPAGRCRARHLAGPRRPVAWLHCGRPGGEHDRTPQLQPFAAGAALGGRTDLVVVQALRQRPRRAVTAALVLGDPAGAGYPSRAGCVHRLRYPVVVAAAATQPWAPASSSSTPATRCGCCWAACWPGSVVRGPGRARCWARRCCSAVATWAGG